MISRHLRTAALLIAGALIATIAVGLYALAFVDLPRLIGNERVELQTVAEIRDLLADCQRQNGRQCIIVPIPVPHYGDPS